MVSDNVGFAKSIVHSTEQRVSGIFYIMIILLYLVLSSWNGLFFDQSFETAAIGFSVLSIVFFIWIYRLGIYFVKLSLIDILTLIYFLISFLSLINPANTEYAILGLTRLILYFCVYFFVRMLISVNDKRNIIFLGIVLSGLVYGIFGLSNGFGTLHSAGAIFDPVQRRLASNFQYPNTFSIYQAVVFLFAIMYQCTVQKFRYKLLCSMASYISLISIMLTYSRGTWLAVAGMIILSILLSPRFIRINILISIIKPIISMVITISVMSKAVLVQNQLLGWISFLFGILSIVVFTIAFMKIENVISIRKLNKKIIFVGSIVLIFGFVIFISLHGLPKSITNRLSTINFQQFSVVQRFLFYKNGLKILKEHPLLGAGPNSWMALYERYQTYPYLSRQSHSFLIDIIMNTGIIGAVIFLILMAFVIIYGIKKIKNCNPDQQLLQISALVSLIGLVGHGAIDFDFAYGTINILMWILIALSVLEFNIDTKGNVAGKKNILFFRNGILIGGIVVSIVSFLLGAGYLLSEYYLWKASLPNVTQDKILSALNSATVFAPYRSSTWIDKAKFEDSLNVSDQSLIYKNDIIRSLNNAVDIAPHDPDVLLNSSILLAKYGEGTKAVELAKLSWENAPYHMQYADQYIVFSEEAGVHFYQINKQIEAKNYFKQTIQTYQNVEARIQGFKNLPSVLHLEYPYQISDSMRLYTSEAAYYLGNYSLTSEISKTLLNSKNNLYRVKAMCLYEASNEKLGNGTDLKMLNSISSDVQGEHYLQDLLKTMPIQ